MSSLVPWEDVGAGAARLPGRVANGIRNGVCSFRQSNPRLFDGLLTTGAIGPQRAISRGFWNEICANQPVDVPPVPDSAGGRCPALYHVDATWTTAQQPSGSGRLSGNNPVIGPISGVQVISVVSNPSNPPQYNLGLRLTAGDGTPREYGIVAFDAPGSIPSINSINFVRVDGLPDDCGDQPITQFPPAPITNNFQANIDIGGISVPLDISLGDITVVGGNVVSFSPVFNTDLGGVTFSLGGVDFEFNPEIPIGGDDDGTVNDIENVINNSTNTITNEIEIAREQIVEDLTEILEKLNDIHDDILCCACNEGTVNINAITNNTEGGTFTLPPKTIAVKVAANLPFAPQTRVQSRSGSESDIWFWGSVAIGYGDSSPGVRQPLHYEEVTLPCLPRATSVTVSLNFGNTCRLTAFTLECET